MLVNGYEVGDMPTQDEFRAHRKVEAFEQRETVAQFIDGYCVGEKPTQDEFERICAEFAKYQMWTGAEERDDLLDAFNEVMWGRSVY